MPDDWSFYRVFDFYLKAHKVFNLKFDGQKRPTQVMKEMIHELSIELAC